MKLVRKSPKPHKFRSVLQNFVRNWFPIAPFLGYWFLAYMLWNLGPFINPELRWFTWCWFGLAYMLVVVGYWRGLGRSVKRARITKAPDIALAGRVLRTSAILTFLGTALLVFDRLYSGAGSFDLVQNQLSDIRADYADRTTILTAIAVVPQAFKLLAIGSYFYCLMHARRIARSIHAMILCILILEAVNMVLTASRGSLFWTFTYVVFYLFYCARVDIVSAVFSVRFVLVKGLIVIFIAASFSYFYFVAKNREVESVARLAGQEASVLLKDYSRRGDYQDAADLGARYSLYYYITHGFRYLDAILIHAPVLNLDLVSPLGIRVEHQIARFSVGYVHPAKREIVDWVRAEGLSEFGWPTAFGAATAFFGTFGALGFFYCVGHFSGYATRRYAQTLRLSRFLLVVVLYSGFNLSFDWFFRDFEQLVALLFTIYLIFWQRPIKRQRVSHQETERIR